MNKRDKDLNVNNDAMLKVDDVKKLNVYYKIQLVRSMEQHMIKSKEEGRIECSLYLSSGQEAVAAALSEVLEDYQIFAQHRSGDIYICFGGSIEEMRDELFALRTGCASGKGGHIGLQFHKDGVNMYGDNLLIGQCVPRGVGAALGNGEKTLCIFGDGAGEEDYVLESIGFAATKKLPVLFVCMDNNLAILTEIKERRSWSICDVASSFGMNTYDLSDDPWSLIDIVSSEKFTLPALINVRVCREYWHVGTGKDGEREWKRDEIVKQQLCDLGYEKELKRIDKEIEDNMYEVWR